MAQIIAFPAARIVRRPVHIQAHEAIKAIVVTEAERAVRQAAQTVTPDEALAKLRQAPKRAEFKVGKRYMMRSVCDHNCVWEFAVVRRSDKSVWLREWQNGKPVSGKPIQCRIKEGSSYEMVYPKGRYSMAPILTAEKVIE